MEGHGSGRLCRKCKSFGISLLNMFTHPFYMWFLPFFACFEIQAKHNENGLKVLWVSGELLFAHLKVIWWNNKNNERQRKHIGYHNIGGKISMYHAGLKVTDLSTHTFYYTGDKIN